MLLLRHDQKNEERDGRRGHRENGKQAAPGKGLNDRLGRTGGGQGAEGAQHDVAAIGEGDPLRREPQDDGLEAGHQADSDAEADKRAANDKRDDAVGKGEHERPGGGKEEQAAIDKAWPVTVEQRTAGENIASRALGALARAPIAPPNRRRNRTAAASQAS